MNEPRLRFKADDEHCFPEWNKKTVSECTKFIKDGTHGTHKDVADGHPLLSAKDIFDNVVHVPKDSRLISDEDYNKIFNKYNLQVGDVLITIVGTLGRTALVTESCKHVAFQRSVGIMRPDINVIKSDYLKTVCDIPYFQNELEIKKNQGAQAGVYLGTLSNIKIPVPSLPEQQKIASLFTELDNLIQSAKEELEGYRELKQCMLQKMFPKNDEKVPEIRFPEFSGDWEQRKLGEIFEEYSEKHHEELPALTIIQGGGTILRDDSDRKLQYDKSNLSNYKMVNKDDFIVHLRSFEGGLEKANSDGIISPAYHTFHGENIDSMFYYLYFRSYEFISKKLVAHVYGIRDGRSIDIEGMKTIKIPYTSYEEQKKIGDYFRNLDNLIMSQQQELDGYKELKKGLLQQMFC